VVQFGEKDVVRHNLVQQIIRAYEEYDVVHSQRGGNTANGKAGTPARESVKNGKRNTARMIVNRQRAYAWRGVHSNLFCAA